MDVLFTLDIAQWQHNFAKEQQEQALDALEAGKILYFPKLNFALNPTEQKFLSPYYLDPKAKNISFNRNRHEIKGTACAPADQAQISALMQRYADASEHLIHTLLPKYSLDIQIGRTSLRPIEVTGRVASYRKDDTRLHVDAFPATPNQGRRILRVFTNINPEGKDRVWRVGERFEEVVTQFYPKINPPFPITAKILKLLRLTRGYRTAYDHYMLQIHNSMKADMNYQQMANQVELRLPPGSTWIVYTDRVSHAAMSGQHLLEQTFYLPVAAMRYPERSPLRILEQKVGKSLQ